ncbi:hypothetical protein N4G42_25520, partial [Acidovorax sp. K2F]|nr:hypothetical protein [Acidovorax sp. K2F]
MLDDLKHHLHEAVNQIEAAQDFDPGPRRLLMLLLREAVAQDHALGRAFGEALAKRYQSLRYLAAGAGGQLATTETMEIASDTPLVNAGKDAANIALWCSYDIETLAAEVTLLGEECDFEGNVGLGAKARCFGV